MNCTSHHLYFDNCTLISSRINRDYSAISATLGVARMSEYLRLDRMVFNTFRVSFVSSQGFSKSGNPDVLKLFHRHSVWMIRISVLVIVYLFLFGLTLFFKVLIQMVYYFALSINIITDH
jgi:hypothetical protein